MISLRNKKEFQIIYQIFGYIDNGLQVFKISDIYKFDEKMEETMKVKYGHWNSSNGIITYEPNIWKRRSNMHGYNLR